MMMSSRGEWMGVEAPPSCHQYAGLCPSGTSGKTTTGWQAQPGEPYGFSCSDSSCWNALGKGTLSPDAAVTCTIKTQACVGWDCPRTTTTFSECCCDAMTTTNTTTTTTITTTNTTTTTTTATTITTTNST